MGQYPPKRNGSEQLVFQIANRLQKHHEPERQVLATTDTIKIVCISDTHSCTQELPTGDLLVHAGDISSCGTLDEIQEQLDWLSGQSHEYKVLIAGNHDLFLDETRRIDNEKSKVDLMWRNLIYLQDKAIDLTFAKGRAVKIYGNPYTPKFGNFAFQYPPSQDYWAGRIASDADIVLTHGPPLCHLDTNDYGGHVGCPSLLKELYRTRPKLVVCGHIHESAGQELMKYDKVQQGFESALLNKAGWSTLAGMMLGSLSRTMTSFPKCTRLVNAAVTSDHKNSAARQAVVVEL